MTDNTNAREGLTEIAKAAWDEAWDLAFGDGLSAGHPLGHSHLDRDTEWADSEVVARIATPQPQGGALTDEQILAIGRQHFRPGHDPKAEPAFIAAVRAILAASATSDDKRDAERYRAWREAISGNRWDVLYAMERYMKDKDVEPPTPQIVDEAADVAIAALQRAAENTAAIAAKPAANSSRAQIIARAVAAWDRKWPEQLTSGVMFYEGERITKAEFLAEVRA